MIASIESSQHKDEITPDMMLPDLLRRHPHLRPILDRHGLKGCGGRYGPVETIAFFARAHGIDEHALLGELKNAAVSAESPPAPDVIQYAPSLADTLYRRFFLAAIAITLTLGASWGVWLLWRIGFAHSFTGASILQINAHGHAQIFGWVGLFIMGFAYQAFPRLWHTQLGRPQLAVAVFFMMLLGIILRTTAMALDAAHGSVLAALLLGGALEIAAALLFTVHMIAIFRHGEVPLEPYIGFIFAALLWFIAMSIMGTWHAYRTMAAPGADQLVWQISTYQAPLRDLQIHGLALFMILGVSIRILPPMFGLAPVPPRRAWTALALLTAAVLGEITLFIAYRWTGNLTFAYLLMIPWLLLAIGAGMIALPWRLWRPAPTPDRSAKFVRIAYAWLAVSLAMLLLLPFYQALSRIPFSHAYYGAIRHAVTVGFISVMIMGIAAKVVPTLNGFDLRRLGGLWGPFLLINAGCFLRVSLQVATDWNPFFYRLVGISGLLEVTALAWWGAHLLKIMRKGKQMAQAQEEPAASAIPGAINMDTCVADIIRQCPAAQAVFDQYGFTLLRQPVLQRTVARHVTLAQAAHMRNVSATSLLRDLRQCTGHAGPADPSRPPDTGHADNPFRSPVQ